MNASHNGLVPDPARRDGSGSGEDTLRLIASLPAPPGLANRVQAGLRTAPHAGRVLLGRGPLRPPFGWMYSGMARGFAAAAIVCVVAGGGWQIYSRIQPSGPARIVVVPAPGNHFSIGSQKLIPQPIEGPVLAHPPATSPEVNVVAKVPKPAVTVKKKQPSRRAAAPVQ